MTTVVNRKNVSVFNSQLNYLLLKDLKNGTRSHTVNLLDKRF